jgi:ppGpp synthetase/RelA/SpoT-type nucleotidyltranferase
MAAYLRRYGDFTHAGRKDTILRKRILDRGIETSLISSRTKTLNSFLEKLQRKNYDKPFEQLTDFAGVRVVCLYRGDLAKVAEVIREEFVVVEDVDKVDELGADQFGYGARHYILQLGKSSSGARYDDLKKLVCEVQVRTVVQDAWAIIQHHIVYKRESQVPTQLQRKLNSLAGLFETVDDQFERIRSERDAYVVDVRQSAGAPDAFLENELNLDSFKEYLTWAFPGRGLEAYQGQGQLCLDGLLVAGYKTLLDVHRIVGETDTARKELIRELGERIPRPDDGSVPANVEVALALALTSPTWEGLIPWRSTWVDTIRKYRTTLANKPLKRTGGRRRPPAA